MNSSINHFDIFKSDMAHNLGSRVSARCVAKATMVGVGFQDAPVGHNDPPVM